MTSIDEVVNKLAEAAIDARNPHLRVFRDPAFVRLTRLIRALRAIGKGEKPEDDDDDDDCDEEKYRFFEGQEAEDFVFFTVFGSEECEEGDVVYSMSTQLKKLKSLADDPFGGHVVIQFLQEFNESCVDDVDEENASLPAGTSNLSAVLGGGIKKGAKTKKPMIATVVTGTLVPFGDIICYNIKGSSNDKRVSNWLKAYLAWGYGDGSTCYIASENPACGHTVPLQGNIVGGHIWNPELKKKDKSEFYYILPICKRHNKRNVYDEPQPGNTGWLQTTTNSMAWRIPSTSAVPGWKDGPVNDKLMTLIGSKPGLVLMAGSENEAGECHEITQPKQLTHWLLEEVHQIALEFGDIFKEVIATVMGKLREIIESAGKVAQDWAESEGKDINRQLLIPIYGIYQAIKRRSSLKSDAIGRFHSGAQSALANYKNECLGDVEQARRKKRLSEETDKVMSSEKWKDRIVSFEATIASKVPTLIGTD